MKLRQVREYHADMQVKGVDMRLMAFMLQSNPYQWRSTGWVVSGYKGDDSHQLFENRDKACEFMATVFN
jgi:hypothetical protein